MLSPFNPPSLRPVSIVLLVALMVVGCRAPFSADGVDERQGAYAARPGALEPDELPPPLEGAGAAATDAPGTTDPDEPAPDGSTAEGGAAPTPPAPARTFTSVGAITDPPGDHGLEGPAYADILAASIEDDGVRARISVDFAEAIPQRLREGEVMGIGVDLWRDPNESESDYQLFADGGEDGWLAHLDTPNGLVDYPGEFRLGGRRLVFELSWQQLGGLRSGHFRVLANWSQRRLPLNAVSQDRAPDRGLAPFGP